jgi:hypothetical protein
MATEAELETVDTEGQSAPAVTSQKSVTVSDPAVVALSEVKLSSQKTTNKSYKSDCSNITRPEGYLPVGQRPSVPLVQSTIGITSEWLTEVYTMRGFLKEGGKVTSCNVKPLGEGEGVMGLLAICTVELENAEAHAPLQFVAKFSPVRRPLSRTRVAATAPTAPAGRRARSARAAHPSRARPAVQDFDAGLHAPLHLRRRGALVQ